MNSLLEHQHSKSQEMQADQGFWQTLIVAGQPSKPSGPGETALNDPAFWQQNKAFLGFWQLDHDQFDPVLGGLLSRSVAGVTLIYKGDFDRIPGALM